MAETWHANLRKGRGKTTFNLQAAVKVEMWLDELLEVEMWLDELLVEHYQAVPPPPVVKGRASPPPWARAALLPSEARLSVEAIRDGGQGAGGPAGAAASLGARRRRSWGPRTAGPALYVARGAGGNRAASSPRPAARGRESSSSVALCRPAPRRGRGFAGGEIKRRRWPLGRGRDWVGNVNVNVMGAEVRWGSVRVSQIFWFWVGWISSSLIKFIQGDSWFSRSSWEWDTASKLLLVYMPTPRYQTPSINDRDMKTLAAGWIPCMHESNIRSTTLYLSL
jgi:hypothetical protein